MLNKGEHVLHLIQSGINACERLCMPGRVHLLLEAAAAVVQFGQGTVHLAILHDLPHKLES